MENEGKDEDDDASQKNGMRSEVGCGMWDGSERWASLTARVMWMWRKVGGARITDPCKNAGLGRG